jgi:hypothetical protein
MTLDEFLNSLLDNHKDNPEAQDCYDYEALAFDAGVEYALKKVKEFLATNSQPEQKVTLPEYLDILYALSNHREDEDFGDRDVGWEESGYRSAIFDVERFVKNSTTDIDRTLEEYAELEKD